MGTVEAASAGFFPEQAISACHNFSMPDELQRSWAAKPIVERLAVLRGARHRMAAEAERFAEAISPALPRSKADSITAELVPLLDGCRFLERNAVRILRPRKLSSRGQPFWLRGIKAEVHRDPLGMVLIIAPSNFPLFLAGAQALQALAAGNGVRWKPAPGGRAVALLFAEKLEAAGLPAGLLCVLEESVEAAQGALAARPDKVVFTGACDTGRVVLTELAKTATPAVMELSGADAVIALPGADLARTAKAVAFGLRLNGGQVCMSPRRLFADTATIQRLLPLLERELDAVPAVPLTEQRARTLTALVENARAQGADIACDVNPKAQRPLLIRNATPEMAVARSDIFAPVLSVLEFSSLKDLANKIAVCEYGLTVALFCSRAEESKARTLGLSLRAGAVILNDVIAPTVDPRVPFGGRGNSGYGVTRGKEGLLEMTAPKVLLIRRGGMMRHLDATSDSDASLLANLVRLTHGRTWSERWHAMTQVVKLGRARSTGSKEKA